MIDMLLLFISVINMIGDKCWTTSLSCFLEKPLSPSSVDSRSIVKVGKNVCHLFGVASYLSHGCSGHTHTSLPNWRDTSAGKYLDLQIHQSARRSLFPFIIRFNYGLRFKNAHKLECVEPSCYISKASSSKKKNKK